LLLALSRAGWCSAAGCVGLDLPARHGPRRAARLGIERRRASSVAAVLR